MTDNLEKRELSEELKTLNSCIRYFEGLLLTVTFFRASSIIFITEATIKFLKELKATKEKEKI